MNGYELSRSFFDWCFENPEKIKPNHAALFFYSIEHCNRLGWKEKFGLPTSVAMEAIGIKSYNTYKETLNNLVEWGFIIMIEKSKNQYTSNIIALSYFDKALDKALDKAMIKHATKQGESTGESTSSIIKQLTNNEEPIKQETIGEFVYDKKLSDKIMKLFGFTETANFDKLRSIKDFQKCLWINGAIENFKIQFDAYFELKSQNPQFKHAFKTFLGDQKELFNNGAWNSENWVDKLNETNGNETNKGDGSRAAKPVKKRSKFAPL